jgi:hypothetical protein
MGFKSAFKGLTTTIVAPPSNASKWQMGFYSALKGLTTTIVAPPSNASKWQMGFNSAFKGLMYFMFPNGVIFFFIKSDLSCFLHFQSLLYITAGI